MLDPSAGLDHHGDRLAGVCDSIDLAEHLTARAEQPQIRPRLMRAISNGGGVIRICQADFNQAAQTG